MILRTVAAVVRRPDLWVTAVRQALRTAVPGWWRRPPFLPLPGGDYLRFRLQTQYGDDEAHPDPADAITYLEWCRSWDRARARRRPARSPSARVRGHR